MEWAKNVGEEPEEGGKGGRVRGESEGGRTRGVANSLNYLLNFLYGTSLALQGSLSVISMGFHDRHRWI